MPKSPRELHHVGVELETPGNIWSVPTPPADWLTPLDHGFGGNGETASATGPARSSVLVEMPQPQRAEFEEEQQQSESNGEAKQAEGAIPSPQAGPKPGRVVLKPGQLVIGMRGRLRKA